jgi:HPt (histidine-containing phosphotransfer) domain-containing protein
MEGGRALVALDLSQLRSVTLNDRALMREVVGALVNDASRQIENLRRAIEHEDTAEAARLAHSLMGACRNVGAVSMAAAFHSVERKAVAGDFHRSPTSIEHLLEEVERLRLAAGSI